MRDAQLKDKEMLKVKINNRGRQPLPTYATALSAGMDLRANIEEDITLLPLQRQLVPTGLHIALPEGYEAQIRPQEQWMPTIVAR